MSCHMKATNCGRSQLTHFVLQHQLSVLYASLLQSHRPVNMTKSSLGFPHCPHSYADTLPQNMPWSCPSKSFPIHYSGTILLKRRYIFGATYSVVNKQRQQLCNLVTACSTVRLEEVPGPPQAVKQFALLNERRRFIAVCTTAGNRSVCSARFLGSILSQQFALTIRFSNTY